MFDMNGQRHIHAFSAAMRRLADPGRSAMADPRTCVVISAGRKADLHLLAALAAGANAVDADVIHLEFEPGAEAEGPRNIVTASMRENGVIQVKTNCAVWADPRGVVHLLARVGKKSGLCKFHPDGMEYCPGRPSTPIPAGLKRGAARLHALAAEELARTAASNDDHATDIAV